MKVERGNEERSKKESEKVEKGIYSKFIEKVQREIRVKEQRDKLACESRKIKQLMKVEIKIEQGVKTEIERESAVREHNKSRERKQLVKVEE